jgi:succinate dehydrogenase/fumarate reductase flavoprotein subunit
METGRNMSRPPLLSVLSHEGETALKELQDWGITLRMSDGHASVRSSAPTALLGGAGFTAELAHIAREMGVEITEDTVVTDLLVNAGRVTGVECVQWKTGAASVITASAVILANGGAGYIYHRTDNPARITGDGYYLALQAGLELTDMEFVQFYPLGWDEPGFPTWMIGLDIVDSARVTDEQGDEFFMRELGKWGLKNGNEANLYARDRSARLIAQYANKGKVLLHLEELSSKQWQSRHMQGMLRFYPAGVIPWEYGPIQVSPVQHYFTGGIVMDENCRTGISGLFACGEVTGGVDGASRVGGNALTNVVVFGLRAGREAAGMSPANITESGSKYRDSGGSIDVHSTRQQLRRIVQQGLGPVRTQGSIEQALEQLANLRDTIGKYAVNGPQDRLAALEMPGMLYSALAVGRAALLREESRGVHFREDYPEEREEWQKPITVKLYGEDVLATIQETHI